jgi:N utilization substance protein B
MSRKAARETAMKLIFEHTFGSCTELTEEDDLFLVRDPETDEKVDIVLSDGDRAFLDDLMKGVADNEQKINEIIEKYAIGWKIDRMPRLDKVILQLSLYELLFTDISEKVAINEAVQLAKKYSTADSAPFINGVLGKAIREKE